MVKKNYSKVEGVSERIAKALLESGLKSAEVAKKMNVFPTAISRWKTGATEPTPSNLNTLAKILKVDVNWLMSGSGNGQTGMERNPSIISSKGEEVEMLKDEVLRLALRCNELLEENRLFYEGSHPALKRKTPMQKLKKG